MDAGKFFWFIFLPATIVGVYSSSWVAVMGVALLGWVVMMLVGRDEHNLANLLKHAVMTQEKQKFLSQRVSDLEQEVAELKQRLVHLEQLSSSESSVVFPIISQPENKVAESFRQPETLVQMPVSASSSRSAEIPMPTITTAKLSEDALNDNHNDVVATLEQAVPVPVVSPAKITSQPERVARRTIKRHAQTESKAENPFWAWFMRGNPLLKVGALVLFLGLAFLLRYVGGQMPLGMRYVMVLGAGVVATSIGMKLQQRQREYGLTLQGFGFGVMYLTTLAAVKLHPLLSSSMAFVMMVLFVVVMIVRAVSQDAKMMAQVAVIGGLAAPVLVRDGGGSHLILFGYLALINTAIAVIAWFKAWRSLNLIGLAGTLFIAISWGISSYQPELFFSSELFLVYHWLLYTVIACLFARKTLDQEPLSGSLKNIPNNASLVRIWQSFCAYGNHIGILDSSLLFGSALASFGLQYALLQQDGHAAAWAALAWAAVYSGFALYFARLRADFAVMKQAFTALFLVFLTLAIPLAFEQRWTAMAWALEAALVYAFGVLQRQPQMRAVAMAGYLLAAWVQLQDLIQSNFRLLEYGAETLLQGSLLGALLAAISGVLIYCVWTRMRRQSSALWERRGAATVLLIGLVHAITLPMMVFGRLGCLIALAIYALVFAAAQWRHKQIVLSGFAVLCVLISFACGWGAIASENGISLYWQQILVALSYVATAFMLHRARWQPEKLHNQTAIINFGAGWGVLWLALWLGHNAMQAYLVLYHHLTLSGWLWAWLVWQSGLMLGAHYAKWRAGLQSAALLSLLFAGFAFAAYATIWAREMPLSGSLFLIAFSLLGGLTLVWLPESSSEKTQRPAGFYYVAHLLTLPLYLALWTRFSGNLAQHYWQNALPWSYLIIPLVAWWWLLQKRNVFKQLRGIYWQHITPLLAIYAALWLMVANFVRPPESDLPYLPILNAVELGSLAVLYVLYRWLGAWLPEQKWTLGQQRLCLGSLPALFLLLLSGGVMRLWHIFGGVNWRLNQLLASFGVQASLSIVWALAAIVLMVSGNRIADRRRWLIGASVMSVVVLKLFFVELGNSGGIARIVSFIVVGLLLLLVGWFAPVPPKENNDSSNSH